MHNAENHKMEKRQTILSAALKVIRENGFHRSRMEDIAREAQISYGLMYHYFNNKEDLFEAIIASWWSSLKAFTLSLLNEKIPFSQKLERLIYYFLDTYHRDPDLVSLFVTEISRGYANLNPHRLEHFKSYLSLTEKVFQQGQDQSILRRDLKGRYLTFIFLGALETFISIMVFEKQSIKNKAQKDRIAQSILKVFLEGAAHRASAA
jgi:TetR/AcrR family fatty acid metabolism transcriptional regulator